MNILSREELLSRKAAGNCQIETGEYIDLSVITAQDLDDCVFQNGSGVVSFYSAEPPPLEKIEPLKEAEMPQEVLTPDLSEVVPMSDIPVVSEVVPDAGVVNAVVGMADQHLADFSALPKDPTGLGVIMAVVAVAGGGTAWKFYNDHSKRKHEQEMAKIEKGDQNHSQCTTARVALEAKVSALETALNDLKQQNQELKLQTKNGSDTSEMLERLEKLEQSSKKKGKK